jgi:YcxB-like protein
MDVVEGKLTLTAEDLDRGGAHLLENVRTRRNLLLYGSALILFGVGAGGLTHAALAPRLIWIGVGVGLIVYGQLRRAGGAKRIAAMKEGEREVSYRFDAQGVAITSAASTVSVQYGALHRHIDADSAFLLYTHERSAQIVPKRAFDPTGVEQIRQWLGARARAQPRPRVFSRLLVIWAVLVVCCLIAWRWLAPGLR